MTGCKTDISRFSISMIYGLVSVFLICFMCTDVSAIVTCYKNTQWSIALQCFSCQVCGRKVKGLCSGACKLLVVHHCLQSSGFPKVLRIKRLFKIKEERKFS